MNTPSSYMQTLRHTVSPYISHFSTYARHSVPKWSWIFVTARFLSYKGAVILALQRLSKHFFE